MDKSKKRVGRPLIYSGRDIHKGYVSTMGISVSGCGSRTDGQYVYLSDYETLQEKYRKSRLVHIFIHAVCISFIVFTMYFSLR